MGMTTLNQIGVLPALLIVLGGLLILRNAEDDRAQRRFILYLLAVAVLLLLALLAATLVTRQGNSPSSRVSSLLMMSSVVGVLALLALRARKLVAMGRAPKALALLLLVGYVGLMASGVGMLVGLTTFLILPGAAVLVLGWALGRRFRKTAIFAALLLLLILFALNASWFAPSGDRQPLLAALLNLLRTSSFVSPRLAVVLAAVLLTNTLRAPDGRISAVRRGLSILLALALLGYLAYSIFWASVWDQTSDGLGGLFLMISSAPVAVAAGMVMTFALNGRRRMVGILFTVLAPLLLYQAFERGWDASYHAVTEARAERIAQSLEEYKQREGVYPATLDALTPRYLLGVPQPVELQGEEWCYQGGDDFFRLGAFAREYFSTPVELRVYHSAGDPDSVWRCEERLPEMKERYDW